METRTTHAVIVGGMAVMTLFATGTEVVDANYIKPTPIVYESNNYASGISYNISGYTNTNNLNSGAILVNNDKLANIKKINMIAELEDNWNGNGASSFSDRLLKKVKSIVIMLDNQPEIFPTANNSIQLEYDKPDGSHMEIEIFEDGDSEVFEVDVHGNESLLNIDTNVESINKVVNDFYG